MNKYFKILFLFFITSHLFLAQSKSSRFEHISQKDGLSQNTVTCILKDSKGFMWFGTLNGLNRYDGKSFKVYKHAIEDINSLCNNQVQAIHEDKNGNLWIGTFGGGFDKFELKTEMFTHYRHDPNNSNSLSDDFVLSIYEDRTGNLWIGTNGSGINKFDINDESFVRFSHDLENPKSLSHNIVRTFYEDEAGILWIGTDGGGLNKFDKKNGIFTRYKHDKNNPNSLSHDFVLSIIEDEEGFLWIATHGGGLNKFDKDKKIFSHFKHDPNNINSLANDVLESISLSETETGVIWIATAVNGIDKFDIKKGKFSHYKHDPVNLTSISTDITRRILEDNSGLVWIGTGGKGLCKYNRAHDKILHYKFYPNNPNSLNANFLLQICEDKSENLWIGTKGHGLNKFDRKKGIFNYYKNQPNNKSSISSNTVNSIIEKKLGILWIGTTDGVNRFDTKKNKFTIYKHDPQNPWSLSNNIILTLYQDRKGNLWLGTMGGGLNKLIPNNNFKVKPRFIHYKHEPANLHSISDNSIINIYEDDIGFLWVGTMNGGLNKFDIMEKKFIRYQHDPQNPNSLSNNFVTTIYQDKSRVLWIGTFGGGLNKFNPDTETFTHFREKDGLANDVIFGILEDKQNNLWISTRNGLSKFNTNEMVNKDFVPQGAFKNYYVTDGFQDNEYNLNSYFQNQKGEMFFGGINGFNIFYPDSLEENLNIPTVAITDFKVFNNNYNLDTSITYIKKIVLSYNENFFSLEFAALDYSIPGKNSYAYRLEGLDIEWNYVNNRNYAHYTNLSPGNYVFHVKGSNNDGVWNEEGTSVKIIILPPWWETWWAYTIYFILVSSFLYGFFRFETNRKEMQHRAVVAELQAKTAEAQKEAEKEQMRSRIASDLHDEIGGNLSSIAMIGQALEKRLKLPGHEKERLRKIPHIARITAESMRDIVWFVNPANDSLEKLLAKMRETANLMLEGMEVDFNFEVDKANFNNDLNFRRNLFLLYKEILQNIVRHAKATQVTIKFDQNEKQFTLSVKDNGIGFNTKAEFRGNGLKNFKRRAEEMNGEIVVSSEPDMGTRVKLSVKIP